MPPLTPANQLIRARNVTASEVGALLGEHPYTTPGAIWDRIMGLSQPKPQTLAMMFGSDVEPILKRYAERALGATIRLNSATYQHPRVHLCATPDGMVTASNSWLTFPRDLVELKSSWSQNRWRDGLPKDIEWQCRAQMACAHRSRVVVYVFSGQEKLYEVAREKNRENRMTRAVEAFWHDYIEREVRPPDEQKPAPSYVYRVG